MSKEYYIDVSAKMLVEADDDFNVATLADKVTVLNKGGNKEFSVFNCLIEEVSQVDPVSFYNLVRVVGDGGGEVENKFSGLTKLEVEEIKNDLLNLKKLYGSSSYFSTPQTKAILDRTLRTLEGINHA